MSIKSERVKKWRKTTKQRLVNAFGGKCCICGYDKCTRALVFHHLNEEEKDFHWGKINGNIRSWKTIVEEIKKCVMLCTNCHMEVHDGVTNVPHDARRFDETLIRPIRKERVCRICGKPYELNTKVCSSECRIRTHIRKVDWSTINVVELKQQYKTFEAVGDLLGVTGRAVSRKYKQIIKNIPR